MRRKHLEWIIVVLVILVIWLGVCNVSQSRKVKELEANQPSKNEVTVIKPTVTQSPSISPETNDVTEECNECQELTRQLLEANENIEGLSEAIIAYQKIIEELENEISSMPKDAEKEDNSNKNDIKQVEELEKKLDNANTEIENLKKDKKSLNSKIDELEASNEKLKAERDSAKENAKIYQNSWNEAEMQKIELEEELKATKANEERIIELENQLNSEKEKVLNLELILNGIENGTYETYLSLKFPVDGNLYKLRKDTTLYADPSCTVEIKKFYDLSFVSCSIDKAEAPNSLAVYVLRLANGQFCYVPQNIGKPSLVTEEEFWNLYGENPDKFEWIIWEENWQY